MNVQVHRCALEEDEEYLQLTFAFRTPVMGCQPTANDYTLNTMFCCLCKRVSSTIRNNNSTWYISTVEDICSDKMFWSIRVPLPRSENVSSGQLKHVNRIAANHAFEHVSKRWHHSLIDSSIDTIFSIIDNFREFMIFGNRSQSDRSPWQRRHEEFQFQWSDKW